MSTKLACSPSALSATYPASSLFAWDGAERIVAQKSVSQPDGLLNAMTLACASSMPLCRIDHEPLEPRWCGLEILDEREQAAPQIAVRGRSSCWRARASAWRKRSRSNGFSR